MDPQLLNTLGPAQLIGSSMNKAMSDMPAPEGEGENVDKLELNLDDQELLDLRTQWEDKYRPYETKLKDRQKAQKAYYLGKKDEDNAMTGGVPIASNLMFEAEETFLPAALSKNPEPVVYADNTKEGNELSGDVKTMLQYHADTLVLRAKLTVMTRLWSIYFLGVLKHGWDSELNDIKTEVIDPQKLILDPEAYIDAYGDYTGTYIGERKTCTASDLVKLFPEKSDFITLQVLAKMGTPVTYTEWWSDDYCFYTYKDEVLDKHKNPHFNYTKKVPALNALGEPDINEDGTPAVAEEKGSNHFAKPKKPYTFLAVFSLGEQPHDITGLIEQNIPNQNRITRRTNQIDYNLSKSNNSEVFSENNFTQETAKQAAGARAKGNPILIPSGSPIAEAIHSLPGTGVDAAHFQAQAHDEENLRSIFGTQGISSQAPNEDTTARGMILNQQFDNSRIGGGIGDRLEQVADNTFNWWVQLYYVYYDEPHFAAIMGQMKAVEYIMLSSQDLNRHLVISVSPDSMKPHDEVTEMNQALDLWREKALDIKTLLTQLNFPDPQNTAAQVWLYQTDPAMYGQLNFPELTQEIQKLMMMQQPQPSASGAPAAPGAEPPVPEQPPGTLSESPASASLAQVPLPT